MNRESLIINGGNISSRLRMSEASKTRVLIVDFDRASLEYTYNLLSNSNYQVVYAEKAAVALSMIYANRPKIDIVLTDFFLPDMHGFEFVERILQIRRIPVLFLSHFCDGFEVIRQCLIKGAKFCFYKPLKEVNVDTLWEFRVLNERNLPENFMRLRMQNSGDNENGGVVDNNVSYRRADKAIEDNNNNNKNDNTFTLEEMDVNWNPNLHTIFVHIVSHIRENAIYAKKIQQAMNVSGLTHGQIAIHLMRFRLCMKQKDKASSSEIRSQSEHDGLVLLLQKYNMRVNSEVFSRFAIMNGSRIDDGAGPSGVSKDEDD